MEEGIWRRQTSPLAYDLLLVPTEGASALSVFLDAFESRALSYQSYLLSPKIVDPLLFSLFDAQEFSMLNPLPRWPQLLHKTPSGSIGLGSCGKGDAKARGNIDA